MKKRSRIFVMGDHGVLNKETGVWERYQCIQDKTSNAVTSSYQSKLNNIVEIYTETSNMKKENTEPLLDGESEVTTTNLATGKETAIETATKGIRKVVDENGNPHFYDEDGDEVTFRIRKLTPRECFRLMSVPENEIDKIESAKISRSQQYKLAGNSIVRDVMVAIFDKLFINREPEPDELGAGQAVSLF